MPVKSDERRVDAATHAQVRRLAVKAVRRGMTQAAAAATFGVTVRAVNKARRRSARREVQSM